LGRGVRGFRARTGANLLKFGRIVPDPGISARPRLGAQAARRWRCRRFGGV